MSQELRLFPLLYSLSFSMLKRKALLRCVYFCSQQCLFTILFKNFTQCLLIVAMLPVTKFRHVTSFCPLNSSVSKLWRQKDFIVCVIIPAPVNYISKIIPKWFERSGAFCCAKELNNLNAFRAQAVFFSVPMSKDLPHFKCFLFFFFLLKRKKMEKS